MVINVRDLEYLGEVEFSLIGKIRENVEVQKQDFSFGKCYCLNSKLRTGGWGLSWLFAGKKRQKKGLFLLSGKTLSKRDRRNMSQCVGLNAHEVNFFSSKSIRNQIEKGLKKTNYKNAKSVDDIAKIFELTPEKIDRSIDHVSAMRFKASLAIGYAYDKKIYCFPWMDPDWIMDFKDLWLIKMVSFLKSKGCLILIPTYFDDTMEHLFDDIVHAL